MTINLVNHECAACKQIGFSEHVPILPAYADEQDDQLYVYCLHCKEMHLHGGNGSPMTGSGDGHREAHCHAGGYDRGYILKCVGLLTDDIQNQHNG